VFYVVVSVQTHQRRRHHREHLACRRLPQGRPFLFHQFIHDPFLLPL